MRLACASVCTSQSVSVSMVSLVHFSEPMAMKLRTGAGARLSGVSPTSATSRRRPMV
jgi:hypothetical protein